MLEKTLIPSVEKRIGSLLEYNRRRELAASPRSRGKKTSPTITLSREFGCEAYPVVECLQEMLEKKTGENWLVMDKELLNEVAKNHDLSEDILGRLGEKPSFLDEMLATFSSSWKSDREYFQLLCEHIVALAEEGNVILMGRGGAYVTQPLKNCKHFRLFASEEFKVRSVCQRLEIPPDEAAKMIEQHQRQRDRFIRTFLDRDSHDPSVYHLLINNDLSSTEKIARTIMDFVLGN
jgi:cytidylate kinase